MAIPTGIKFATTNSDYDYAFVPTTGVDFPAGPCRALWVAHNNVTDFTVITANGDSVVLTAGSGMALIPLRVKQISANAGTIKIIALY